MASNNVGNKGIGATPSQTTMSRDDARDAAKLIKSLSSVMNDVVRETNLAREEAKRVREETKKIREEEAAARAKNRAEDKKLREEEKAAREQAILEDKKAREENKKAREEARAEAKRIKQESDDAIRAAKEQAQAAEKAAREDIRKTKEDTRRAKEEAREDAKKQKEEVKRAKEVAKEDAKRAQEELRRAEEEADRARDEAARIHENTLSQRLKRHGKAAVNSAFPQVERAQSAYLEWKDKYFPGGSNKNEVEKNNQEKKRTSEKQTQKLNIVAERLTITNQKLDNIIDVITQSNKILERIARGGMSNTTESLISKGKSALTGAAAATGGFLMRNKGLLGKGAAGAVGGLALDYAGDVLSENGYNNIGAITSIGGDALTGASLGAAIGSVVPMVGTGIGAAIGGAAGGAYGLYNNWNKFGSQHKQPPVNQDLVDMITNSVKEDNHKSSDVAKLEENKPTPVSDVVNYSMRELNFKASTIKFVADKLDISGGLSNSGQGIVGSQQSGVYSTAGPSGPVGHYSVDGQQVYGQPLSMLPNSMRGGSRGGIGQAAGQGGNSEPYYNRGTDLKVEDRGHDGKWTSEEAVRARLIEQIRNSKLNGFVPADGEQYGVKTGSPEEWAHVLLGASKLESAHSKGMIRTDEKFTERNGQISEGLFSFSKTDIGNYGSVAADMGMKGRRAFTQEEMDDPDTQIRFGVGVFGQNILKHGTIRGGLGATQGPVRRGELRIGPIPQTRQVPDQPNSGDQLRFQNGRIAAESQAWSSDTRDAAERLRLATGDYEITSSTGGVHARGSMHYPHNNPDGTGGRAMDVSIKGLSQEQIIKKIEDAKRAGFTGIGISDSHIHLDTRPSKDGQPIIFDEGGGARTIGMSSEYLRQHLERIKVDKTLQYTLDAERYQKSDAGKSEVARENARLQAFRNMGKGAALSKASEEDEIAKRKESGPVNNTDHYITGGGFGGEKKEDDNYKADDPGTVAPAREHLDKLFGLNNSFTA